MPPYQTQRAVADRLRLMAEMFLPRADWVLSGSIVGWGAATATLVAHFDLVVFVQTSPEVRLQRLRAREAAHFGATPWRQEAGVTTRPKLFVEWASHYEDGRARAALAKHEGWLAQLPCPVLRSRITVNAGTGSGSPRHA